MTVNKKIADIKDYKLDYITRLFKSIRNKRFESYVIQRIWNQLNNINVKFVTQQYFSREDGKYALADLYLPQINLIVEIDELQHETNTNKILDDKRSNDIIAIADVDIQRVKIYKENREQYTLEEVNQQISNIVELIEQKIREKGENFIPLSRYGFQRHGTPGKERTEGQNGQDDRCLFLYHSPSDCKAIRGSPTKWGGG